MKVAVTADGLGLDAHFVAVFGRCASFVCVDLETMDAKALANRGQAAAGGAGIQAAQLVIDEGVEAVITGNVGPNAFQVLNAAGVHVYLHQGGTVRQAVAALKEGGLSAVTAPTAPSHAGASQGHG
jgi:predicted Fe-Mo cluster-binding NifX family protein